MTEQLRPMLTPGQRERLKRIRQAFQDGIEQHIDASLEVAELALGEHEMDQLILEALRDMPPEHLGYAVHVPPDRLSSGYSAADLQADIDALRADGLI